MTTKEIYEYVRNGDLESLRIMAAEADGHLWSAWNPVMGGNGCCYLDRTGIFTEVDIDLPRCENFNEDVPNYSTSLDAIFAAEERLGLHNRENRELRIKWGSFIHDMLGMMPDCPVNKVGTPLVSTLDEIQASAIIRTAAFILTAQYKKK